MKDSERVRVSERKKRERDKMRVSECVCETCENVLLPSPEKLR